VYALQNLNPSDFLRDYWQQKPLLLRNALADFKDPLSADELAGLALEPELESRIVQKVNSSWLLQQGPFQEHSFRLLAPWTLLVQGVDHYVDTVSELWQCVNFLPSWRRDDVMVSYATDGGGVGPHYDNYDVFLLQGSGQRRWQIGQMCGIDEALISHDSLRILADFHPTADYVLNPGDVLYLPPRLAHWGEAIGECMTYSLGFRAPRLNDMLSRWVDDRLETMDPERLYTDPPLSCGARAGEITDDALRHVLKLLQQELAGDPGQCRWLGEMLTESHMAVEPEQSTVALASGLALQLAPGARLAWTDGCDHLIVFANGVSLDAPQDCQPLIETLCRGGTIDRRKVETTEQTLALFNELASIGCIDVE
jgi:50S ribosomal protein L16 3-hydroxylase